MAFMNQFIFMMAPSFYLYVFYNFGTLKLSPDNDLHYPTVQGFWIKLITLWSSFAAYIICQFFYVCVKWKDPKNTEIENKRDKNKDEEDNVSDQEDQAMSKIIF